MNDEIKEDEMNWECRRLRRERKREKKCIYDSEGKTEGKRQLGRRRFTWKNSTEMDFAETGCYVICMHFTSSMQVYLSILSQPPLFGHRQRGSRKVAGPRPDKVKF
jgi:hypothetical protein